MKKRRAGGHNLRLAMQIFVIAVGCAGLGCAWLVGHDFLQAKKAEKVLQQLAQIQKVSITPGDIKEIAAETGAPTDVKGTCPKCEVTLHFHNTPLLGQPGILMVVGAGQYPSEGNCLVVSYLQQRSYRLMAHLLQCESGTKTAFSVHESGGQPVLVAAHLAAADIQRRANFLEFNSGCLASFSRCDLKDMAPALFQEAVLENERLERSPSPIP